VPGSYGRVMDLDGWFSALKDKLETAYLGRESPWQESGMSGPEERWTALRKPVADCIDRSGTFLDIGCANGYLLECVQRWVTERGLALEVYGLDISESLVERARTRLPDVATRLWVANAFTWIPPRRFDFVRTELVYVPRDQEAEYVRRLLEQYVADDGALLVANYLEGHPSPEGHIFPGAGPTTDIRKRLGELGFSIAGERDGFDVVKGRKTRVAILRR